MIEVIREIIDSLKKRVPEAFLKEGEELPEIPIKEKLERVAEPVPFNRFYLTEEFPPHIDPSDLIPAISDVPEELQEDKEVRKEVEKYGTDALGWYQPFHFFESSWGIFIRWRGIKFLAYLLNKNGQKESYVELMKHAFKLIHSHEYFHFLTEWATSFLELVYSKSLYKDYFNLSLELEDLCDEESLANAYAFHQLETRIRNNISKFFEMQPEIYRNYRLYIEEKDFILGKRKLGMFINNPNIVELLVHVIDININREPPWENLFNAEPKAICLWEVPIYILFEREEPPVMVHFLSRRIYNVRIAAYSKDHKPRHIHVWIPADSKIERRVCWPNYTISLDGPPLSRSQIKRLRKALSFNRIKEKIDQEIGHIPICPPCTEEVT